MSTVYTSDILRCRTEDIVAKTLETAGTDDTYFIVPEGIKASVERMVMEKHRVDKDSVIATLDGIRVSSSMVRGDVLSFVRLAVRILETGGRDNRVAVDEVVMRNAVYRVLYEYAGQFKVFGRLVGKFEYVDMLINLIGDFTRYGIDEDGICSAYETAETDGDNSSVYVDKLHDIKLLIRGLGELGRDNGIDFLTDPISEAIRFLEELIADDSLRNDRILRPVFELIKSRFTVIGFGSFRLFTPQELKFIGLMDRLGADWSFYPIYKENETGEDDRIYSFGNLTVKQLVKIMPECSVVPYEDKYDVSEPPGEDPVFAAAKRRYAFEDEPADEMPERTGNIVIANIDPIDDRIAYISNEIIRLTRSEGYRYKDIRIVCADSGMLNELTGIMEVFGLDHFVDHRIVLTNTPVFSYAVTLAELPLHGYEYTDVLRLLRTGIADMLPSDCDLLENYCVKYNITTGAGFFDKDFFTPQVTDEDKLKYLDRIIVHGEEMLLGPYLWDQVICRVLVPLKESAERVTQAKTLKEKAEILGRIIGGLKSYVESLTGEMIDRGDTQRASALVMGYKEVMNVLAAFASPMNDVPISQEAFVSLLRIDMRNKAQGTIPLMVDSVEITDPSQAFMTECKVMFLVGANERNFPYSATVEGIMTQEELNTMAGSIGVELPDKALAGNQERFIKSALMFSCVSDKLYIVNENEDEAGSVTEFMKKFSSDSSRDSFYSPLFGVPVLRRHDHLHSGINPETMHELLKKKAPASVTSIESFNTCPMQYMLNYILKIKQRVNSIGVKPNVIGTIVHSMYETSLKRIASEHSTPDELIAYANELIEDPAKAEAEAKRAFDEYCEQTDKPNEKTVAFRNNSGRKAMRIFARSLPAIVQEAGESGYVPAEFETRINQFDDPLSFTAYDGSVFDFKGSIDRVDKKFEEDGLRIIDYKTGHKTLESLKVLAGVQIQLFAYASALEKRGDKVDAVGYSQIGLSSGKDGKTPKLTPDIAKLSEEELRTYTDYSQYVIQKSCDAIASGDARAILNTKAYSSDHRFSTCGFCPYSGTCGNRADRPSMEQRAYLKGNPRGEAKKAAVLEEMNRRMNGEEDSNDGN